MEKTLDLPTDDDEGVASLLSGLRLVGSEQRDRDILTIRSHGVTLQEIATAAGLSRERVRQICKRDSDENPESARSFLQIRRMRAESEQQALGRECQRLQKLWGEALLERPGSTESELLQDIPPEVAGVPPPSRVVSTCIVRFIGSDTVDDDAQRKEDAVKALRLAATFEVPLRRKTFDCLASLGEIDSSSAQSVAILFGSWTDACAAAGIDCVKRPQRPYGRHWSRREISEVVVQFLLTHDVSATAAGYEHWRASNTKVSLPSLALVRQRVGTWSRVKHEAHLAMSGSSHWRDSLDKFRQCTQEHQTWL